MTDEKWDEIVDMVKDKFELLEHDTESFEDEGGGAVDYVVFNGPMGKLRLERDVHAKVVGTKVTASRRIGSEAREEKIYSDSEKVDRLKAFRWDEAQDDWVPFEEFSPDAFGA